MIIHTAVNPVTTIILLTGMDLYLSRHKGLIAVFMILYTVYLKEKTHNLNQIVGKSGKLTAL